MVAAQFRKAVGYSLDERHRADAEEGGHAKHGPEEVIRERIGPDSEPSQPTDGQESGSPLKQISCLASKWCPVPFP